MILAGAGSGKTSVVVAKVCYMIDKGIIKPEEILILAFNKKAQQELTERFKNKKIDVDIRTFHSFGLSVIGQSSGEKPDICKMSESPNNMSMFIENTLQELLQTNESFLNNFLQFIAYYKIPFKDQSEFDDQGQYFEYQNNYDMKTLKQQLIEKQCQNKKEKRTFKKETVKSYQELVIANFLTLNGIQYSYEEPYKHKTSSPRIRQYKPDFYLPEYDIYIEHFGIDRQGKTASYIDNQKYLADIDWKVTVHRNNNTNLVQTFSYEFSEGRLLDLLREKLKQYNVVFRELSKNEIIELLNPSIEDKQFTKLFTSFLNHFKSNRHDVDNLKIVAKSDTRKLLFLDVFESIYDKYIKYQRQHNCIDFDDMILKALEYVEDMSYLNTYKHVFIDEFQDISTTRFNFIKELILQNNAFLTVVGDDWQSINRFAGSNIYKSEYLNSVFRII